MHGHTDFSNLTEDVPFGLNNSQMGTSFAILMGILLYLLRPLASGYSFYI